MRSNPALPLALDTGLALPALLALAAIVLIAFTVETALGFGATLISVALGSMLLTIEELLPALVPLNLALSTFLTIRYRKEIDLRFLGTRLLPLMVLGMPLGILAFRNADASLLRRLFGGFLLIVSIVELARMRRATGATPARLSRPLEVGILLAGGMVHGAFATGGPMAVYVVGRTITDKGRYRATLCMLWTLLNTFLVLSYLRLGELHARSITLACVLVPSCALGLVLGEILHRRMPAAAFRGIVFAGLALVGIALAARG